MAWDDLCTICGEAKVPHKKNHKFTTEEDPQVIPVDRTRPPTKAETLAASNAVASKYILRALDVLTRKGLLTGDELVFILGGAPDGPASTDGEPDPEAGPDRQAVQPT